MQQWQQTSMESHNVSFREKTELCIDIHFGRLIISNSTRRNCSWLGTRWSKSLGRILGYHSPKRTLPVTLHVNFNFPLACEFQVPNELSNLDLFYKADLHNTEPAGCLWPTKGQPMKIEEDVNESKDVTCTLSVHNLCLTLPGAAPLNLLSTSHCCARHVTWQVSCHCALSPVCHPADVCYTMSGNNARASSPPSLHGRSPSYMSVWRFLEGQTLSSVFLCVCEQLLWRLFGFNINVLGGGVTLQDGW